MQYNIAIVDDHILIAKAIASIINEESSYKVLYEVSNGKMLQEKFLNKKNIPDVVLLDISMPVMDGFETALWLKQNHPDVLSQSLQAAMNQLIIDKGNDPKNWAWGNIHHATFNELGLGKLPFISLFWNRQISSPGGLYTVNVGTYDFKTFDQADGPGYRQIIDLSHFDHSVFIAPMGQSNDPFNKHYQDQLELWRDGKYISMRENQKDWGETQILYLDKN